MMEGLPTNQSESRILAYVRYIGPRFVWSVLQAFQNPIPEPGHEDWSGNEALDNSPFAGNCV